MAPDRIGRFHVLAELARGPASSLHLASDSSTPSRFVALRWVEGIEEAPDFRAMRVDEAQLAKIVSHPSPLPRGRCRVFTP